MKGSIASLAALVALTGLFAPAEVSAAVPQKLNYQGKLGDASGNPLTGTYSFRFKFYDAASGGTLVWSEDLQGANAVAVSNGVYSVVIGQVSGQIADAVFAQTNLYLEIDVAAGASLTGAETLSPREQIVSAGFAVRAGATERLANGVLMSTFSNAGNFIVPYGFEGTTVTLRSLAAAPGGGVPGTLYYDSNGDGALRIYGETGWKDVAGTPPNMVTTDTNQAITGIKTFTGDPIFNADAIPDAAIAGLSASKLTGDLPPTVTASSIAVGAVGTDQIADDAITLAMIAQNGCAADETIKWNGTDWVCTSAANESDPYSILKGDTLQAGASFYVSSGTFESELTVVGDVKLAAGVIDDAEIADLNVSKLTGAASDPSWLTGLAASKILTGALASDVIASSVAVQTVGADQLIDASVSDAKIADVAVGKITGSQSNPAFIQDLAAAKILPGTLGTSVVASSVAVAAVGTDQLADDAITLAKIGQNGCAADETIKWNGADWVCTSGANETDPYAILKGSTLQAGASFYVSSASINSTLTVYGDAILPAGSIDDAEIAGVGVGKITGSQSNPSFITDLAAAKIAAGALGPGVIASSIAVNAVGSAQIIDGSISNADITSLDVGKITGSQSNPTFITDLAAAKIAAGALGSGVIASSIAVSAVATQQLADGAVTPAKIADAGCAAFEVLRWNGAFWACAPQGGNEVDPLSILKGDALQAGASFYVSSGTFESELTVVGDVRLAAGVIDDAEISGVAVGKITGSASDPSFIQDLAAAKILSGALGPGVIASSVAASAVGTQQLAAGAVTDSKVADVAVGKITGSQSNPAFIADLAPGKISAGALPGNVVASSVAVSAVGTAQIADDAITLAKIGDNGCAAGEVMKWNGAAWTCATPGGSEVDPLAILKGSTLQAGASFYVSSASINTTLTVYGDVVLPAGAIGDAEIGSVDVSKIGGSASDPSFIQDLAASKILAGSLGGGVIASSIAAAAAGTQQIADGAVTDAKLAATGLDLGKFSAGSLAPSRIGAGVLPADVIASSVGVNTVDTEQLSAAAVTDAKVADVAVGKITGSASDPSFIQDLAASKILAGSLDPGVIASSVAFGAVGANQLAGGAVTDSKVSDVDVGKITGSASDPSFISDLSPTKISAGTLSAAVVVSSVGVNTVGSEQILDDAITLAKIAQNGCSTNQILRWNGSAWACAAAGGVETDPLAILKGEALQAGASFYVSSASINTTLTVYGDAILPGGSIGSAEISDLAVGKLTGTVSDPSFIQDLAASKILAGSLGPNVIASSIAARSITEMQIEAGAVTDQQIASVGVGKITGSASNPSFISDLPASKISAGILNAGVIASSVAASKVGTMQLADAAVTNAKLAATGLDLAKFTAGNLAPDRIDAGALGAGVIASSIAVDAIGLEQIQDNSIADAKISNVGVGKISGSASNPTFIQDLAAGKILAGNLGAGVVASSIAVAAVGTTQIADDAVSFAKIGDNGCGANDVMKWNGVAWVCASGAGLEIDPLSILKSGSLQAGASFYVSSASVQTTLTVYGDAILPAGSIGDGEISAVAVGKITGSASDPAFITDLAAAKISAGSLGAGVVASSVAAGAVDSQQIADSAVTDAKIAAVAVGKITGSVSDPAFISDLTPSKISAGALGGSVIASSVAASAVDTDQIADAAVTDAKLATGLNLGKFSAGSLDPGRLATGVLPSDVVASSVAVGAVGSDQILDGSILSADLAGVDVAKITGSASNPAFISDLSATKLQAGALPSNVFASSIAVGAVGNDQVAPGSIDRSRLSQSGCASNDVLIWNGSVWACASSLSLEADPYAILKGSTLQAGASFYVSSASFQNTLTVYGDVAFPNGSIGNAEIADLDAAKLTGSVSDPAFITDLAASKIASGALGAGVVASSVAVGAVGSLQIADGSVVDADIAAVAVGKITGSASDPAFIADLAAAKIAGGTLNSAVIASSIAAASVGTMQMADAGCGVNEVLKWNGTTWNCGVDNGVGTESDPTAILKSGSLQAGASFYVSSGSVQGTLTIYGGLNLPAGAIGSADIAGVDVSKITGSAANPSFITNIAAAKVAAGALGAGVIASSVGVQAIGTEQIASLAVTNAKLAASGLDLGKFTAGTLAPNRVGPGALGGSVLASSVAVSAIGSLQIADGSVANVDLASGIDAAKITAGSLDPARVGAGSLGSSVIASSIAFGSVGSLQIADGAVADADIAAVGVGKITGSASNPSFITDLALSKLQAGTLPGNVIASSVAVGAVGVEQIGPSAVGASELAAGAVTLAKIADVGCGVNEILKWNGAAWACAVDDGPGAEADPLSILKSGALQAGASFYVSSGSFQNTLTVYGDVALAGQFIDDAEISGVNVSKIAGTLSNPAFITDLPAAKISAGQLGASVMASSVAAFSVGTGQLAAGAVTNAKLASGLDASKIAFGTMDPARIGAGELDFNVIASSISVAGVGTAQVADGAITDAKLASGLDASKLTTGSLDPARVGAGALGASVVASSISVGAISSLDQIGDLSCGNLQILKWNGSAWTCSSDDGVGSESDPFSILNQDAVQAGAKFNVSSGTFQTDAYVLGRAAVGTADPASRKFTVRSTDGANTRLVNDGTGNAVLEIQSLQERQRAIDFLDAAGGAVAQISVLGTGAVSSMTFRTSGLERVKIDENGNFQVGTLTASTIGAGGYMTLANLGATPPASRGRYYFDPNANGGLGALKISLDGISFVQIATGSAGGGISSVASDAAQFTGDGTLGNVLALKSSSVTLQGNVFNGADQLVRLDGAGKLPVLDGSALTNLSAGAITGSLGAGQIASGALGSGVIASSIAVGAVGTEQLQAAAVTNAKLASGLDAGKITAGTMSPARIGAGALGAGVVASSIAVGAIDSLDQIGDLSCGPNQVMKWSGSAWTCAADATGLGAESDPLAVLRGSTLQAGASFYVSSGSFQNTLTVYGDVILPAGSVDSGEISSVDVTKIGGSQANPGFISSLAAAKISAGSLGAGVIASSLAVQAVGTEQIGDAAVTDAKIAGVAVGKITGSAADPSFISSLAPSKIASGALGPGVIASSVAVGTVGNDQILAGAVDRTKLAQSGCGVNQVLKWTGAAWTCENDAGLGGETDPYAILKGDALQAGASFYVSSGSFQTTLTVYGDVLLPANSVDSAEIASLSADKISGSVSDPAFVQDLAASKILAGTLGASVVASSVAVGSVGSEQIVDGSIADSDITSLGVGKITGAASNPSFITDLAPSKISAGALPGDVIASSVAVGAVGTAQIAAGAVTDAKIVSMGVGKITGSASNPAFVADLAPGKLTTGLLPADVIASSIAARSVGLAQLADTGCGLNEVLQWNGSAWVCDPDDGIGAEVDPRAIWKGGTLQAGASFYVSSASVQESFTVYGPVNLSAGSIDDAEIAAVGVGKITGAASNPSFITDLAPSKLQSGALPSNVIASSIAANAINSPLLIVDNAVTDAKIASLGVAKITGSASNPSFISDLAASKIAAGSLGSNVIASSVAAGAVGSDQILDGSISDVDIAGLAVGKITGSASDPAFITDLAAAKIAAGSLGAGVIASSVSVSAVGAAQLADASVTFAKLADEGCANDEILKWNGSAWVCGTTGGETDPTAIKNQGSLQAGAVFHVSSGTLDTTLTVAGDVIFPNGSIEDPEIESVGVGKITGSASDPSFISDLAPSKISAGLLGGDVIASSVAANTIGTAQLKEVSVSDSKIVSVAVGKITGAASNPSFISDLAPSKISAGDLGSAVLASSVAVSAVGSEQVLDGSLRDVDIADLDIAKLTGTASDPAFIQDIAAEKILAGLLGPSVIAASVAVNSVGADQIVDGSIIDSDITSLGVGKLTGSASDPSFIQDLAASKILDGALGSGVMASSVAAFAVGTGQIANAAVTNAKLAGTGFDLGKFSTGALDPTRVGNGVLGAGVVASSIAINTAGTEQIQNLAVTDAKINDVAVGKITGTASNPSFIQDLAADKILAGSLGTNVIASSVGFASVGTLQLADGAVTDLKVSNVGVSKISGSASDPSFIQDLAAGKILSGPLGSGVIASSLAVAAVHTDAIQDGVVTNAKIVSLDAAKLTGSVSDPSWLTSLSADKITGGDLGAGVIASSIAANTVGTEQVIDGSLLDVDIAALNVSKLTGSAADPAWITGLAATKISAGALAPGVIASSVAVNTVGAAQIIDGSIVDSDITSLDVGKITGSASDPSFITGLAASKILAGTLGGGVIASSIAVNTAGTQQLQDGAVTDAKLAATGLDLGKFTAGTLDPTRVGNGVLGAGVVASSVGVNTVGTLQVVDGSLLDADIASLDVSKLTGSAADPAWITSLSADKITGGTLGAAVVASSIAVNAVGTDQIQNNAVTNAKIAGVDVSKIGGSANDPAFVNTLAASKIESGALGAGVIASSLAVNTAGNGQIVDGSVDDAKISDVAVGKITGSASDPSFVASLAASKIESGALGAGVIASSVAAGAVDTEQVQDASITDAKIADVAVGKITGSASNPSFITDLAASKIQAGALGSGVIASSVAVNSVGAEQLADGAVDLSALADMGCGGGEILKWNGSAWACDAGGGGETDPTAVKNQAAYQTGAQFYVSSGTFENELTVVGDVVLANGVIDSAEIAGLDVGKLSGTVNDPSWLTGLSAAKVNPGALGNSVIASSVAVGAIGTPQLADLAVNDAKINDVAVGKITGSASNPSFIADLAPSKISAGTLASNVVASSLAVASVGTDQIQNAAVTNAKIASVDVAKITGSAADPSFITSLAASKIEAGSLGAGVIASSVAVDSVGNAQLADGAVGLANLADMGCNNDEIMKWNGSSWICGATGGESDPLAVLKQNTLQADASYYVWAGTLENKLKVRGADLAGAPALEVSTGTGAADQVFSVTSGGQVLLHHLGLNTAPSLAFAQDSDTGFLYDTAADGLGFVVAGVNRGNLSAAGMTLTGSYTGSNVSVGDGNASVPAVHFGNGGGDNDTGMYSPAENNLAFVTGALERMRVNHLGQVGIGTTANTGLFQVGTSSMVLDAAGRLGVGTATPDSTLEVAGAMKVSGGSNLFTIESNVATEAANMTRSATKFLMRASADTTPHDFELVTDAGGTPGRILLESTGDVGIGTADATAKLHVAGDIKTDGNLIVGANTLTTAADKIAAAMIDNGALGAGVVASSIAVGAIVSTDQFGDLSCGVNEILKWNGSAWTCQVDEGGLTNEQDPLAILKSGTLQAGASFYVSSGTFETELTVVGDVKLANNVIDSNEISGLNVSKLTGSVADPSWITSLGANKIAAGSLGAGVIASSISVNTVGLNQLADMSCGLNEVLKWNGAVWNCATDNGVGTESDPSAIIKSGTLQAGASFYVSSGSVQTTLTVYGDIIAPGQINFTDMADEGCGNGEVMKWSGSAWACATDNGVGSEADPFAVRNQDTLQAGASFYVWAGQVESQFAVRGVGLGAAGTVLSVSTGAGAGDETLSVTKNGQVLLGAMGTGAAPALAFGDDPDTGLAYDNINKGIGFVAAGVERATLYSTGLVLTVPVRTSRFDAADGTVGTPAFNFFNGGGDIDTGMYSPAEDTIGLVTGGRERLRVNAGGQVGIGTSANTGLFQVGTSSMVFDANGNVGIGTTAPGALFHVGGAVSPNRFFSVDGQGTATSRLDDNSLAHSFVAENRSSGLDFGAALVFNLGDGTNALEGGSLEVGQEQAWTATAGTQDSYLSLYTRLNANPNEAMRINSAGSVGIGTLVPGAKLDVEGDLRLLNGAAVNEFSIDGTLAGDSDLAVPTEKAVKAYVDAQVSASSDSDWTDDANGVWNTTKNIGIGTSDPDALLDVNGAAQFGSGATKSTVTATGQFKAIDGAVGAPAYAFGSAGNTGLYKNGSDLSVGVGGSHAATFQSGTNAFIAQSQVRAGAATNATAPAFVFSDDTDTGMFSDADNTLGFATVGAERMRIASNGNVGIGTSIMLAKLTIDPADSDAYALWVSSQDASSLMVVNRLGQVLHTDGSANRPAISFTSGIDYGLYKTGSEVRMAAAGADVAAFQGGTNALVLSGQARGLAASLATTPAFTFSDDTNTGMFSDTADTLQFAVNSTEAVRIDSAGDVGIGTTNPTGKLHVGGASQMQVDTSVANEVTFKIGGVAVFKIRP